MYLYIYKHGKYEHIKGETLVLRNHNIGIVYSVINGHPKCMHTSKISAGKAL